MLLWFRTRAPFASPPRPVGRPTGSYPETGLEEITSDVLEADFWGISVTSGDPLLSRILTAQSRIIGLSSDGLVSNSPGLYPLHDETFW